MTVNALAQLMVCALAVMTANGLGLWTTQRDGTQPKQLVDVSLKKSSSPSLVTVEISMMASVELIVPPASGPIPRAKDQALATVLAAVLKLRRSPSAAKSADSVTVSVALTAETAVSLGRLQTLPVPMDTQLPADVTIGGDLS